MIKCEVIEKFTLKDFDLLENVQRKNGGAKGTLYIGDIFECSENLAKYLTGDNALKKTVVKVVEVEPKKEETEKSLIYCGDETTPPQYEEVKEKPKKKKGKK